MKPYLVKYTHWKSSEVSYRTYKGSDLESVSRKARAVARRRGYGVTIVEVDAA